MQPLEGEGVALDVVDARHQLGDRDRRGRLEPDGLDLAVDARRIVDRVDVELDLASRRPVAVGEV